MIRETTFFGIPLQSRRKRRLIVVAYYLLVIVFPLFIFGGAHWLTTALVSQTFILGSLLGGLKSQGPVKRFEGEDYDSLPDQTVTLNLSGLDRRPGVTRLDEREVHQRDHAHYRAYAIVRLVLAAATAACWLLMDRGYNWPQHWMPVLLWTLLIFVLSLPQAILLWTEPDTITDNALTLVTPKVIR